MFQTWLSAVPTLIYCWQVHVLVIALMCLLGVWAGISRRRWYLRAIALFAVMLLFLPIRAYEPAIASLMLAPGIAIAMLPLRQMIMPQRLTASAAASAGPSSRVRYGLVDLFALTLLVALLLSFGIHLSRAEWHMRFGEAAVSAACFATIAVLVTAAWHARSTTRRNLLGFASLLAVVLAASIHYLWVQNWLLLADLVTGYTWPDLVLLHTGSFLQVAAIVLLGNLLLTPTRCPRRRNLHRGVAAAVFAPSLLWLATLYVRMLQPIPWPDEQLPKGDHRDRFKAALFKAQQLNPGEWSLRDLRTPGPGANPIAADQLDLVYAELLLLAEEDRVVHYDPETDSAAMHARFVLGPVQGARGIARAWERDSQQAYDDGDSARAVEYAERILILSSVYERRGLALEALIGQALQGMGLARLTAVRRRLDCDESRRLIERLAAMRDHRDSLDLIFRREESYQDRWLRWEYRLQRCFGAHDRESIPGLNALESARRRNDVEIALLTTDLAIRCFQERHGRWPAGLTELVPEFLPELPADPYSVEPLRYRFADDEFLLYSVGFDGVDDGGRFPSRRNSQPVPGLDWQLDIRW
jgi:hypothetical protein